MPKKTPVVEKGYWAPVRFAHDTPNSSEYISPDEIHVSAGLVAHAAEQRDILNGEEWAAKHPVVRIVRVTIHEVKGT